MKRKFKDIRKQIQRTLTNEECTRMEIARKLDADYRTIERHLIWLCGTDKVERIKKNKKVYYRLT